jgi:hypothetical protein
MLSKEKPNLAASSTMIPAIKSPGVLSYLPEQSLSAVDVPMPRVIRATATLRRPSSLTHLFNSFSVSSLLFMAPLYADLRGFQGNSAFLCNFADRLGFLW